MAHVNGSIAGPTENELQRIVWVDLEMTGLDVESDHILEVACAITDTNLNIIAEGPNVILHQPETVLNRMNPWCVEQHGKTGLTKASINSKILLPEAENIILEFVKKHVGKSVSPLAGNSVYMDRIFLQRYMPRLNDYLHYRIIDVSTVKELCRRWNPAVFKKQPNKSFNHRALSDIHESIEELRFYRRHIFK